ncbi:MAG: hypothetical protein A3J24_10515 [Deltaproteobacteria bacterium RIFCSPLOWO2_02_FULL_53_8]|nr:MAG: hypothetical protein A3J24_10515 [Deltaproteobacteria bacterium RIFCSPLOWO2_02_FULL_53_8]
MDTPQNNAAQISAYPSSDEITLDHRPLLHPLFKAHPHGISEFTFANIRLFRKAHNYRVSRLEDGTIFIIGSDANVRFFMLPFGIPAKASLEKLFADFAYMKAASETDAHQMTALGYAATEDTDNFDYLYLRKEQADLSGRRFHKKKNLVNLFLSTYKCEALPLIDTNVRDAFEILDGWLARHDGRGDYDAAKEALVAMETLALCGGIFHVNGKGAAFILGEELTADTFVIHFEKSTGEYPGLLQHLNRSFAQILPPKYVYINREQDLGDEGLRRSKQSYRPVGYVKKYKISPIKPYSAA